MPSFDDTNWHDPRHEDALEESVTLLALGEQTDADVARHIRECPECQAELTALTHTAMLGRLVDEPAVDLRLTPSPAVWQGIAAELGLANDNVDSLNVHALSDRRRNARPGARSEPMRRPRRNWVAVAAAAVFIASAGAGGGYLAGRNVAPSEAAVVATAQLTQMEGGPTGVHGSAVVRDTVSGLQVSVTTANLPDRDGYYEVWLYDPDAGSMVAIGTLPQDGTASFPVPPGLDVGAYHVVDVSAQLYDGDPAHQQSVLRGALAQ